MQSAVARGDCDRRSGHTDQVINRGKSLGDRVNVVIRAGVSTDAFDGIVAILIAERYGYLPFRQWQSWGGLSSRSVCHAVSHKRTNAFKMLT